MKKGFAVWIGCLLALTLVGCKYLLPYQKITFETGGLVDVPAIAVARGSRADVPTPKVEGYEFSGWFYDAQFENMWRDTDPIRRDLTLYGKFEKLRRTEDVLTTEPTEGGVRVTAIDPASDIVRIPASVGGAAVVSVGTRVFGDKAESVRVIDLPDGLLSLENEALAGCTYLEFLRVPQSVRSVGTAFLRDAKLLRVLHFEGDPTLTKAAFDGLYNDAITVLAPAGGAVETAVGALASRYGALPPNYGLTEPMGLLAAPVETVQYGTHLPAADAPANERTFAPEIAKTSYTVVDSESLLQALRLGRKPIFADPDGSAARVYDAARAALSTLCADDDPPEKKVHGIFDWVTAHATYDYGVGGVTSDANREWRHASYALEGVFLNGTAVCEGYAKAVELLCALEGIPCVKVIGDYGDPTAPVVHAWNKIKLDDWWYFVDATMGDARPVEGKPYEATDHDFLFDSDKPTHRAYAAFDAYRAVETNFDYWRYAVTKQATEEGEEDYDGRISDFEELKAFVHENRDALRGDDIVQFFATKALGDVRKNTLEALASNGLAPEKTEFGIVSAELTGDKKSKSFDGVVWIVPSAWLA